MRPPAHRGLRPGGKSECGIQRLPGAVLVLSEKPTPIKLLKWDWPLDYKDLIDWIFKNKAQEN
jgi:hypothetical protein